MVGYQVWLFGLGAMAVSSFNYIRIIPDIRFRFSMNQFLICMKMTCIQMESVLTPSFSPSVAAFLSSVFALIWAGSQLAETRTFHDQFNTFIVNGACNGVDILPMYWSQRRRIDIGIFVLNAI